MDADYQFVTRGGYKAYGTVVSRWRK